MSFESKIAKFGKDATASAIRIRRAFTISLFNSVIQDTPVETGRLRGNWQTTEGKPAVGELDRLDKTGTKARREVEQNVTGEDGSIYLTNNLPYVERIEFDGHSSVKAPAGMVHKNVLRVQELINKAIAANRAGL